MAYCFAIFCDRISMYISFPVGSLVKMSLMLSLFLYIIIVWWVVSFFFIFSKYYLFTGVYIVIGMLSIRLCKYVVFKASGMFREWKLFPMYEVSMFIISVGFIAVSFVLWPIYNSVINGNFILLICLSSSRIFDILFLACIGFSKQLVLFSVF